MNIKRWLICAFLFFICFLILRWLSNTNHIIEGYGYRGVRRRYNYDEDIDSL